jgi:hypothetical protein
MKGWSGEKKHISAEKVAQQSQAKRDLRELMENRDEDGYVRYIKALKPNISSEELVRLIELFREQAEQR